VIYGVAGERHSAYLSLGISTVPVAGGRSVIDVQKDSPGTAAGLAVGDVIVALDGEAVTSREMFNRVMAGKLWGDVVRLGITRGGEQKTLDVPLRRTPKTSL
jgi:S1-C subfamily serine protease